MDDPSQSIIWTDPFLGNGNGIVTSGHFANWQTDSGPLTRNVGSVGELYNNRGVSRILSRRRTVDITLPLATREFNLELQHNGVHQWVGGQMGDLNTSPHDPVFWLHHAFVDYIWERFRKRQRRNGINPSDDYPTSFGDARHSPNYLMGFAHLRNIDGYSNVFSQLVTYKAVPTCSRDKPDCGSNYLTCKLRGRRPLCQSVQADPFYISQRPRTRNASDLHFGTCPPPVSSVSRAIQGTFLCDKENDIEKLVHLPIEIVYRRPPNFVYSSFPVIRGKVDYSRDVFSIRNNVLASLGLQFGNLATFHGCQHKLTVDKVYVEVNGLSYVGSHREFAVVDNRLTLSKSTTYVAVKDPIASSVEAIVSAYDSCGRMCLPYCRMRNSRKYHRCSGAIRLTPDWPRLYSKYYDDTLEDFWDFDLETLPEMDNNDIYLKFFCRYDSVDWPWSDLHDNVFDRDGQLLTMFPNSTLTRLPIPSIVTKNNNVLPLPDVQNAPTVPTTGPRNTRDNVLLAASLVESNLANSRRQNDVLGSSESRNQQSVQENGAQNTVSVSSPFPRSRQRTVTVRPTTGRVPNSFRRGKPFT